MNWVTAVQQLRRDRRAGVLITVTEVRGHAPREAGSKMVVAADDSWGTIGGGNLEETALAHARQMLGEPASGPESLTIALNEKARTEHGRQCCGGEVTLLFEHLPVLPAVAVFGVGHVGLELARILARHELDLHLVDSRAWQVADGRLAVLDGPGQIHAHHAPVPELVLGEVPEGTHVLVLTHDHAEDFALCDAALRCAHLGSIGVIGSSAKWRRFQQGLRVEGHDEATIGRIRSPIGMPEIAGKDPATIALGVAADLLSQWSSSPREERAGAYRDPGPRR